MPNDLDLNYTGVYYRDPYAISQRLFDTQARAAPAGGPPLPQMPTTDLHRMPNDLDPVKLYRKTILVFIIVTDAHPRDYDS